MPLTVSPRIKQALKDSEKEKSTPGPRMSEASSPKTQTRAPASSSEGKVGTVKTKGGDYPVYSKTSEKGKAFDKAFGDAKKGTTFTWEGRKYKK